MRTGIVFAATGQKQSGRNRNQEGRFHAGNLTQTAKNPSRTWAGRLGWGTKQYCNWSAASPKPQPRQMQEQLEKFL
jgi:hypothetical protein